MGIRRTIDDAAAAGLLAASVGPSSCSASIWNVLVQPSRSATMSAETGSSVTTFFFTAMTRDWPLSGAISASSFSNCRVAISPVLRRRW